MQPHFWATDTLCSKKFRGFYRGTFSLCSSKGCKVKGGKVGAWKKSNTLASLGVFRVRFQADAIIFKVWRPITLQCLESIGHIMPLESSDVSLCLNLEDNCETLLGVSPKVIFQKIVILLHKHTLLKFHSHSTVTKTWQPWLPYCQNGFKVISHYGYFSQQKTEQL